MTPPFGYGAWLWFKRTRWAQVVFGLGIFYFVMRWKEEHDERRGALRERARNAQRSAQVESEILEGSRDVENLAAGIRSAGNYGSGVMRGEPEARDAHHYRD